MAHGLTGLEVHPDLGLSLDRGIGHEPYALALGDPFYEALTASEDRSVDRGPEAGGAAFWKRGGCRAHRDSVGTCRGHPSMGRGAEPG
jgi:hypothetical protein